MVADICFGARPLPGEFISIFLNVLTLMPSLAAYTFITLLATNNNTSTHAVPGICLTSSIAKVVNKEVEEEQNKEVQHIAIGEN